MMSACDARCVVTVNHCLLPPMHGVVEQVLGPNGRVLYCGHPSGVTPSLLDAAGLIATPQPTAADPSASADTGVASTTTADEPPTHNSVDDDGGGVTTAHGAVLAKPDTPSDGGGLVEVEARAEGTISSNVVSAYAHAVGMGMCVVVLSSLACMQLSRNGSDWWLSQWSADVQGADAGPGSSWIRKQTA